MMLWIGTRMALRCLWAHRLRSVLAMLGIIIGVSAVIVVLSLVAGAHQRMMDRIASMGTNLLVVTPGQRGTGGVMSGVNRNLKLEDALALLAEIKQIHDLAPLVRGSVQVKHLSRNARSTVMGTTVTYFRIRSFEIDRGRLFLDSECDAMTRVAVIGPTTAQNLFGAEEACEQTIKLNGINFRVIGVLKSKGDQGWFNPDDQIFIPYSVAMKQVLGLDFIQEIDLRAKDETAMAEVQSQATTLLRRRHRLQETDDNDFSIRNQADILNTASSIHQTLTLLAGGIASISLLVGGIGIMNIMLVTVAERTREIGIRLAVGATQRDILRQFLLEAVLISGVGGVLGVLAGAGISRLLALFMKFEPSVSFFSVALGLGFATAVGVFFGSYPAHRASRLDPIEALRQQ